MGIHFKGDEANVDTATCLELFNGWIEHLKFEHISNYES